MNIENPSIMQILGNKRLEQLDGLRGISAISVLMCHLIYQTGDHVDIRFYPSLLLKCIAQFGHVSVLIFFVLSGFVIGYTTSKKFTWEEARKYILKRLIRLYPIYFLVILLTFALLTEPYTKLDIIGHLLFLQVWLVPVVRNNEPLWSLHYEFIFYILFLVIWKFNINVNKAIFICFLSGILSAFIRFHPLEILGYFTLWLNGFWLAKNLENLHKFSQIKLVSDNYISYRFWTLYILINSFMSQNILIMIINKFAISSHIVRSIFLSVLITTLIASLIVETKIITFWYRLSITLVFLSVIFALIYGWRQNTFYDSNELTGYQIGGFLILILPLTLFLRKIPVNFLRKISYIGSFSYALYIVHYPIIRIIYRLFSNLSNNGQNVLFDWIANLCAVVLAVLTAWILECWLHIMIAKKLKIYFKLNS